MQREGYAQHIPTASLYKKQQTFRGLCLVAFPICDCKHITLAFFPVTYHQGRRCTKSLIITPFLKLLVHTEEFRRVLLSLCHFCVD